MIHKSIPITDHPSARPYRIVRHAIDANLEVLTLAYRQKKRLSGFWMKIDQQQIHRNPQEYRSYHNPRYSEDD